ncbi:hypothetical protein P7K49_035386, partial [Saguinus oedipus]
PSPRSAGKREEARRPSSLLPSPAGFPVKLRKGEVKRAPGRPGLGAAGGAVAGLAALGPAAGGGGPSLHHPAGAGWLGRRRPLPQHPTPAAAAAAAAPGAGPGPSRCLKEPASGAPARDRSRRRTGHLCLPGASSPPCPSPPCPLLPAPRPPSFCPAPPATAPSRRPRSQRALSSPRSSSSVSSSTSGSSSPYAPGSPRARPESAARRRPPGHVRMEIRQHEWLSASPHEGFEQMRLKSRPKEPSPSLTRVGANFYSSVKQQDYSASVWLRRKDKLEHVRATGSRGPRPGTCRTHPPRGGGRSARGTRGAGRGGQARGSRQAPASWVGSGGFYSYSFLP